MLDVKVSRTGYKPCWFWHKWNIVGEIGMSHYMTCEHCHTRRVKQQSSGYQPINWDWVDGSTNVVNGKLK